MELYGTANSPYTRIVRVLAAELGFEPQLRPMAWRETLMRCSRSIRPAGYRC